MNEEVNLTIEKLVSAGSIESANELALVALSGDKSTAKLARKGLHILRSKGIEPSNEPTQSLASDHGHSVDLVEALVSNVGGTRRQLLLFISPGQFGGSPWLSTFLISHSDGVLDVRAIKASRKEIDSKIEALRERPGNLAVATTTDHARQLLDEAVKLTSALSRPLPKGFSDTKARIGHISTALTQPVAYDLIDGAGLNDDYSFSHDAESFFESDFARNWVLELQRVEPWERKFFDSIQSEIVLDELQRQKMGDKVIDEATDDLMGPDERKWFKRVLEEQAAAVFHSGDQVEAKRCLFHAVALGSDGPSHSIPIARAYIKRSIYVVLAIKAEYEEEAAAAAEEHDSLDVSANP